MEAIQKKRRRGEKPAAAAEGEGEEAEFGGGAEEEEDKTTKGKTTTTQQKGKGAGRGAGAATATAADREVSSEEERTRKRTDEVLRSLKNTSKQLACVSLSTSLSPVCVWLFVCVASKTANFFFIYTFTHTRPDTKPKTLSAMRSLPLRRDAGVPHPHPRPRASPLQVSSSLYAQHHTAQQAQDMIHLLSVYPYFYVHLSIHSCALYMYYIYVHLLTIATAPTGKDNRPFDRKNSARAIQWSSEEVRVKSE